MRDQEERVRPDQRVVDVGCGSGILAIAAARLGAEDISLVEPVTERLAPGGTWLAGGIIRGRLAEVEAALRRGGFAVVGTREAGGWAVVEARRADVEAVRT